jgi:Uri superfamily endonuclease
MSPLPEAGVYAIAVQVEKHLCIRVGALGHRDFARGTYLYVGSARRRLVARVRRHCAPEKVLRWHIDYLTSVASVCFVWAWAPEQATECGLAEVLTRHARVVPGFGASDCACEGHLFWDEAGDGRRALDGLAPLSTWSVEQ